MLRPFPEDQHEPYRIGFVFGTRPEAIKLAPVIAACKNLPGLEPVVCVTAQHRDMLDQVLRFFGIAPDLDLDLMSHGQTLTGFSARALETLGGWLDTEPLAALVVQGDTNTTLVAALAAYHHRIPVAHVEAGLRTYERYEPFPEEGNRRLTDHLSTWHFAPTDETADNLRAEGLGPDSIHVTGNTVVDAVQHVWDIVIDRRLASPVPAQPGGRLLVATVHRRENFGEPLLRICGALRTIADRHPDVTIAIPVHPNPNIRPVVIDELGDHPRIRLIDPPDYLSFVAMLHACHLVLTDSGGVQEEAPVLGKPTLVLRRVTERPEGVASGAAMLVGDAPETILPAVERLLTDPDHYASHARFRSPYGDGHASTRIVHIIRDDLRAAQDVAVRPAVHSGVAS